MAKDPPLGLSKAAEFTPILDEAISMAFATPIAIVDWPDSETTNGELSQLIRAARDTMPSAGKSNVGGWHSPPDFILGTHTALDLLRRRVRTVMIGLTRRFMIPGDYRFKIDGWANILGPGHYNVPHNHPNATWSGVYYVTGTPPIAEPIGGEDAARSHPEPSLGGKIEFLDPRPAAGMSYAADNALQRRCLFAPRPGCMLVFPAWLQHMVHPHQGTAERQSIAFNVTVSG